MPKKSEDHKDTQKPEKKVKEVKEKKVVVETKDVKVKKEVKEVHPSKTTVTHKAVESVEVKKEEKFKKVRIASRIKIPKENYYGTGKRKTSIAKVWLFKGNGTFIINEKPLDDYLKRKVLKDFILSPLAKLNLLNAYNAVITTLGGGTVGQIGACQLGIARALLVINPDFKSELKKFGFLTRDSRIKERKKYGFKRARKGFQYRKR